MPKFPRVSPEIASASLAGWHGSSENRLALQLPLPEYREPHDGARRLIEPENDAAALVLDRDGAFNWVRY